MKQFLDANTRALPSTASHVHNGNSEDTNADADHSRKSPRHVYLGGTLSYSDPALGPAYDMVPVGMVSRFVPVNERITAEEYVGITHNGWDAVSESLSLLKGLPDAIQFPQETWEWTIGRDMKDRVIGELS